MLCRYALVRLREADILIVPLSKFCSTQSPSKSRTRTKYEVASPSVPCPRSDDQMQVPCQIPWNYCKCVGPY